MIVLFCRLYVRRFQALNAEYKPSIRSRWVCRRTAGSGGSSCLSRSGSSVYGANVGWVNKESRVFVCVGAVGLVGSGSGEGDGSLCKL